MTPQEIQEYIKCAKDPIYFLNNYGYVYDIRKSKVDKLSCFDYQENAIRNFVKYQNNIVLKSRQCLPEGTLVDTPKGSKKIENFEIGDEIYSFNIDKNLIELDQVSDHWESGERQCYRIEFENTGIIEVGENHPFFLFDERSWKESKKLNVGDKILKATNNFEEITFDKILKIEKTDFKICYDISVSKNENYFIDGLLVHNTGMSVITAGIVVWMLLFKMDQRILIVANDGAGAIRFLGTVKQYFQFLPKFLFNPDTQSEKDNEKFFSIKNPEGKISWVKAVASSKNAGRGESLTMLILDETAFIENAEDIWMAAGLALSATQGKCIMISTPQGTSNLYHKTWVATKKGQSDFVPFQIHWTEHPVYSLEKEQRTDDYGRTYWTSPWYEKECERLQYDRVKIAQELDLSFEGSRQLVIESGIIEKYKRSIINEKPELFYDYTKPEERFINTKTNFWVWKKPEHGKNYIVGGDVSRGDSKDFSTLEVFDADTCEQVAEYQGKIPPDVFGSLIDRVGRDYNNAYLVIECNSFGLATTLNIKNALKYPEDRIYHSKSIKDIINPSAKVRIKENDDIPGIQTTQVTRPLIISSLNSYMREGKIKINSVRLLEEFDTFIYNGNKPEHADGFNDDLIFALGVLLFVRDTEYFKNFASRDLYKAMIGSISNQKTGIGEKINLDAKSTEGVILTSRNTKADDDNDISWLISS